jgi:predicted phage baseplate assembly protein
LQGEELEVQEWVGRGDYWRMPLENVAETDLRFEKDPATGEVTAVWVRWHERSHLFNAGPGERCYMIERARGLVRFGDGGRGLNPQAGSRISVTYRSGGGLTGNVPAGEISELRTAVPFLASATNPVPASGGAATESVESVRERGAQRLRHRNRALAAKDFEWLAREASPDVARARCLPITGPVGHAQRGWVTLVVVPHSSDARPQLTPEFHRRVQTHLAGCTPAAVSRHVRIIGPEYSAINVRAEIAPQRPDEAAKVEARVRENLNLFLHPLTGGRNGQGWSFGQTVFLSQIAKVIEESEGVDYARHISLSRDRQRFDESVPIEINTLPAAGDHELKLVLGEN